MKLLLPFFLLFICACTTTSITPEISKKLSDPLICEGEKQCKVMWDRAMYFINTNAAFKIQTVNDNMILTYNPKRYSTELAFRVIKQPLGDDKYKIITSAWCDNMFGCQPDHWSAIARAKQYIRTGVE